MSRPSFDPVGFGIDEGTALVVQGRRVEVLGESTVTVCMAACETRPRREFVLKPGDRADLTEFRRAALQRASPPFPPAQLATPCVDYGSLVIVVGRARQEAFEQFVRLAGGPDGRIVVLPTAAPDMDV